MEGIKVRVPATTANLACGFDTLGCALSLYNTMSFSMSEKPSFTGCPEEFMTEENLAWQGYTAVFRSLGAQIMPAQIEISADIPLCRGLGSSAAMLAGGAIAANAMLNAGLSKDSLLDILTPIEGHPDNLAPALLGGMVAAMLNEGKVYYSKLPVSNELRFIALSPEFPLSTGKARAALPKLVLFPDAVFNLSRLALLPRALEEGDEELLALCLKDRLHEQYRMALIPGFDEVKALTEELGAKAFCISGAGPTLLCISKNKALSVKLENAISGIRGNWAVRDLSVDYLGAVCL